MENIWFGILLSFLFGKGGTFPNSAPSTACIDLVPGHTPTNQPIVNPFSIVTDTEDYITNGNIQVTIRSSNGEAESFKGLLLQARAVNTLDVVGTWALPTTTGITRLSCSNANDAIMHSDSTIKTTPVQFRWNAPAASVGPVQFVVTIVKDYSVFWVAFASNIIKPEGTSLCDTQICRYGGTCTTTPTGYVCTCPTGFTGQMCEILPGSDSACDPNPCQNNGLCSGSGDCACTNNYWGDFCQLAVPRKAFCLINPCLNGGQCVVDQSGQICVCRQGFEGSNCEINDNAASCDPDPCRNGGVCVPELEGDRYSCVCPPMFEGPNCETGVDVCGNVECLNGGQCVVETSSTTGYRCNCPRTHIGSRCETAVCTSNPCRNGGTCELVATVVSGYTCACTSSFNGPTCQTLASSSGPCGSNPCGSGGCIVDPTASNGIRCNCPSTHTGERCQISVCSSFPCLNGGLCVLDTLSPKGYICDCPISYTGDRCQEPVVCMPNPCFNGGACSMDANSGSVYSCNCPPSFVGIHCENVNYCYPNPCANSGRCELSSTTGSGFLCNCVVGYSGTTCEVAQDFCNPSPCTYGTCVSIPTGYKCDCYPGYTGSNCEVPPTTDVPVTVDPGTTKPMSDACSPNPCENGGTCYDNATSPTAFSCKCKESFYGLNCELEYTPCFLLNPCKNGATCVDQDLSCLCGPNYRGNLCQFPVSASCSDGIELCIYGDCIDLENGLYGCDCQQGASGLNCEDKDPCDPEPCGPQGTCRPLFNGDYQCDCEPGFQGDTCEEEEGGSFSSFLELVFTYWPVALGILVLIITIIICWIGCHFSREEKQKKNGAKQKIKDKGKVKKKRKRRGSGDSEIELEGTYQI